MDSDRPALDPFAHAWWDDLSEVELTRRLEQRGWETRIARWCADARDRSVAARNAIAKTLGD